MKRKRGEREKKAAKRPALRPHDLVGVYRDKPLTSEEELKKTRREINATNRRRAKDMERRVARYLKGKRVPSSGAIAGMKGDCKIPLEKGFYLVECKLSAQEDKGLAKIPLQLTWFDKIIKDSISMDARFGVLVIHFHGKKQDYVFVPSNAMRLLAMHSKFAFDVDYIRNDIIPRDITTVGEKKRSTYDLFEHKLISSLITVHGFQCTAFRMQDGVWHIFSLEQFRDLVDGI